MHMNDNKLMKPGEFAENMLLTSILDNTFPAGTALPNERQFAEEIGVTRPTLRETLQRLAREGWVTIRHGKPTIVNDFWKQGGVGMLGAMARFAEFLPEGFVKNLLQVRILMLPSCAQAAAENKPQELLRHLEKKEDLNDNPGDFATYDWDLQLLFVKHSDNLIIPLIFNDFTEIYIKLASVYFSFEKARTSSFEYYKDLKEALLNKGKGVNTIVEGIMKKSADIWQELKSAQPHLAQRNTT